MLHNPENSTKENIQASFHAVIRSLHQKVTNINTIYLRVQKVM